MTHLESEPGPAKEVPGPRREADEIDHHTGLRGLVRLVGGARDAVELLFEVAEFATNAIPGADGAGVALISDGGGQPEPQIASATEEFVQSIDAVQYSELGEGPSITCIKSQQSTVSGALGADSRWPRFGGRVARMGVHSALSLPMVVDDQLIGVINCYAKSQDAFSEHAIRLGAQFAEPAAVLIFNAELLAEARARADKLQEALDNRTLIDQAIGIIRSRSGVSTEVAFGRLVQVSQNDNVKLRTVAARLVQSAVRRAQARQTYS